VSVAVADVDGPLLVDAAGWRVSEMPATTSAAVPIASDVAMPAVTSPLRRCGAGGAAGGVGQGPDCPPGGGNPPGMGWLGVGNSAPGPYGVLPPLVIAPA
jgi:hypothetical protein